MTDQTKALHKAYLSAHDKYMNKVSEEPRTWFGNNGCAAEYLAAEGVFVANTDAVRAHEELRN
jgi:hypothetical protein